VKTGHLEEAFFAYLEDVDLGLRAALLNLSGRYVPDAVAYHRGSATLGPWDSRTVEWMTRHQILLLAKFYPTSVLREYWRPILAAHFLWGALAARRGRLWPWLRGLMRGLASSGRIRRDGAVWRADGPKLARVLADSERELVSFEQATGWDDYWRWYIRLAPLGGETHP